MVPWKPFLQISSFFSTRKQYMTCFHLVFQNSRSVWFYLLLKISFLFLFCQRFLLISHFKSFQWSLSSNHSLDFCDNFTQDFISKILKFVFKKQSCDSTRTMAALRQRSTRNLHEIELQSLGVERNKNLFELFKYTALKFRAQSVHFLFFCFLSSPQHFLLAFFFCVFVFLCSFCSLRILTINGSRFIRSFVLKVYRSLTATNRNVNFSIVCGW